MANNKSAEKRNRQNEKRRLRNSKEKSSIRTAVGKVRKALADPSNSLGINSQGIDSQGISDNYKQFVKRIDSASGKGIIHKRTAARRKSRLALKINAAIKNNSASGV